jgi:predicted CoA-binding protein
MDVDSAIREFLAGQHFAVVGASTDRRKYGNKVLRCYLQNDRSVVPVNPHSTSVEGLPAVAALSDMDRVPDGISVITQPDVTESIVDEAIALGIRHIWMQPGAESGAAIQAAEDAGINVIHSGPCLLVVLGYSESGHPR